jgi:hypothetical protein
MGRWIRVGVPDGGSEGSAGSFGNDGTAGSARGAGSAIEGCPLKSACSQRWERLEVLRGAPEVRFCNACRRAVHWAADEAALRRLARQGKCVAFAGGAPSASAPSPTPRTSIPDVKAKPG